MRALLLTLALTLAAPAYAGTLAGVTLPDKTTVGGQELVLNGLGLREKYFIDIYVCGLYLPAKTQDASKAINDDVPKQIVMAMTYDLSKDKLGETMLEGLGRSSRPEAKANAGTLAGWMEDVKKGDQIVLEYVPGSGTTVKVKGTTKGTIPGAGFMNAVWDIYLGPNPPTEKLKKGILGL